MMRRAVLRPLAAPMALPRRFVTVNWEGGIPQVTPKVAKEYGCGVIVDVREPDEIQEVHIVGSVAMPMSEMNKNADDKSAAWITKFGLKPEDGTSEKTPIFVTCKAGMRAQMMCELLASCDKTHVANIAGGMMEWEKTMPADTVKRA